MSRPINLTLNYTRMGTAYERNIGFVPNVGDTLVTQCDNGTPISGTVQSISVEFNDDRIEVVACLKPFGMMR